jgi:hypothetical protein
MSEQTENIYLAVGGLPTFEKLVEHFYDAVEQDPILRPMYPESLEESRLHLALFLAQFFGVFAGTLVAVPGFYLLAPTAGGCRSRAPPGWPCPGACRAPQRQPACHVWHMWSQ